MRSFLEAKTEGHGICYRLLHRKAVETDSKINLRGEVYPSMKKSDSGHIVNMEISKAERNIVLAHCTCQQGQNGSCSHTVALIYLIEQWKIAGYKDIPSLLSSTSLPQQWDKPRGPKIISEPVSQMVIARPGNIARKRKPVMASFRDNRKVQVTDVDIEVLQTLKSSPISYLAERLSNNTAFVQTNNSREVTGSALSYHIPWIDSPYEPRTEEGCGDFRFPHHVGLNQQTEQYLSDRKDNWADLSLTLQDSKNLERTTRLQNLSSDWYRAREKRVTASVFGNIMKRKKKNK